MISNKLNGLNKNLGTVKNDYNKELEQEKSESEEFTWINKPRLPKHLDSANSEYALVPKLFQDSSAAQCICEKCGCEGKETCDKCGCDGKCGCNGKCGCDGGKG